MSDEPIAARVSLAGRALSAHIEQALAPHGIGRGEYRVLFTLYEQEGISQGALVSDHHLNKGVVTRIVQRLEAKGYIERRSDPTDGRRNLLYLTEKAESIRSEIERLQARVDEEITRGLTAEETEAFAEALTVATRNLGVEVDGSPEHARQESAKRPSE